MADAGLQAPDAQAPPVLQVLQQAVQTQQIPHLNWSYFKPEL